MSVGISSISGLQSVAGVRLASVSAGIRYQDRNDLLLIEFAEGTTTAGVFTRNRFCAAPVHVCREHLSHAAPRYWLINSGNANAGTGAQGMQAARDCCAAVAEQFGVAANQVLPFSTGVIGMQLESARFTAAMPALADAMAVDGWDQAARTIMTTDTIPKGISETLEIDGKPITITGVVKGAGMIRPNMATMLGFIATDAAIEQTALQAWVTDLTDSSFNCVTVDGDTSTNDACMVAATGQSGVTLQRGQSAEFDAALEKVFNTLAQALVRDAEGATKFVTIAVEQAATTSDAREVAFTVAHSPLVKTALFASDPNWGRILAAVGRAEIDELVIEKVDLYIGDTCLIRGGEPDPAYTEEQGQAIFNGTEIPIRIVLGAGDAQATVWTSDLSHEYVQINADYRS